MYLVYSCDNDILNWCLLFHICFKWWYLLISVVFQYYLLYSVIFHWHYLYFLVFQWYLLFSVILLILSDIPVIQCYLLFSVIFKWYWLYSSDIPVSLNVSFIFSDIHSADKDGKTALHYASQSKANIAQTVVQALITGGPSIGMLTFNLSTPHLGPSIGMLIFNLSTHYWVGSFYRYVEF